MNKSALLYLNHIIDAITAIEQFTKNCDQTIFSSNRMIYDATLHNLQTMAEATQKLPSSVKDRYPSIPWKDISGFRNILVHDYLEGLDSEIIWSVVKNELPQLKFLMQKEAQNHSSLA